MRAGHTPADTREAAETPETVTSETVSSQAALSGADSEATVQTMSAPKTAAATASAQDADTTMVRVCQCGEHFVMEGSWKADWRQHVMQAHRGSCHWGDNAFTEAEMRAAWPEDFEDSKDVAVDKDAEKEAADKAAKEQAEKEAAEKAAAEQAAKEQAEREAAEKAAAEQAAKEQAAREQAEREAAEKAAKEQAEREAAERAAAEAADYENAETGMVKK